MSAATFGGIPVQTNVVRGQRRDRPTAVLWPLRRRAADQRVQAAVGGIALLGFVALAGPEPSVLWAAAMAVVAADSPLALGWVWPQPTRASRTASSNRLRRISTPVVALRTDIRACLTDHGSQVSRAAKVTAAAYLFACLSYRVARPRHCLSWQKPRSMVLRRA
jgi:hypothetical protein